MKFIKSLPFSTKLAIGSFILGTLIFLTCLIFPSENILMVGYTFTVIVTFLNLLVLINLLLQLFNKKNKLDIIIQISILLTNIPIALIYLEIVNKIFFYKP